mmetsp:Transcript_57943/g.137933  ORF Transcript_57943/g.137933 Transcript_57943/m.137933 type:complete len:364 (-) Transcript_57943:60-1151(-)
MDAKTELNQFCQRLCARPLTKNDILYQARKLGSQWQATVKLNCIDGQEYAGELSDNQKDAEKSAAQQVLIAYEDTVAKMGPSSSSSGSKKRKASGLNAPNKLPGDEQLAKMAKTDEENGNPAMTAKVKVNAVCTRLAKRGLQKGETVYECHQTQNGYQSTVRLACLPEDWATKVWAGYECSTKQKAEQSAAEMALQTILADPELGPEAQKALDPKPPPSERRKPVTTVIDGEVVTIEGGGGGGGGKGKGKGKWGEAMRMWNWIIGVAGKGGKGKGGPSGPNLPRERVTDVAITGEVTDWKGGYGWITPHAEINHEKANARGGKVYVHVKDLTPGLESLEIGTMVQFHAYADQSGVGAEEVMQF